MKYEEYETMLNDLVSNPDTMLTKIDAFKDAIKTDLTSLESLTNEKNDLDKRVRDLQDTNMKLYLSMGGASTPVEEESEEEKIANMSFEEYIEYVKTTEGN